ncbi:MAG: radical SAM protein [Candidatus Gastranaerophilaceae bacterium]
MSGKKKILFIYPPAPVMNREDRCQQPVKELLVIPPLPPMDLMYMAAVAEETGLEARIEDYSLEGTGNGKLEKTLSTLQLSSPSTAQPFDRSTVQFVSDLKEFKPDYLVVNVATTTLENDLSVLAIAKEILPNVITIAKGAHFLTSNTDVLYKYKALDLIIVGEAETTLKEILEGKPYPEIKGLCYRDGQKFKILAKFTGKRPFIKDLDKLPFPARHLVDNNLFRRPDNNQVQAVIKVSRGCPHHCFFCLATPVSGSKVRVRSAENIIEEIRECVETYGIKNFLLWSDVFNQDREWTMNLCEKIIESGLKITWSANTRADTADAEMAELMYESGCRLVSIGVESGSQYILDKIGKKITIDDVRDTVKIFKKAKIKIYNYFVIGLPWDDEDTIEQTVQFAIELDSDFISFYTATPLLGTRFCKYAHANNLLEDDASFESAYFYPVVRTHFLDKERIFELHKQAIRRFYLRPMFILHSILNIRSFAEVKNYFKAGIEILLRK